MRITRLVKTLIGIGILLLIIFLWILGSRYHMYVQDLEETVESQGKTIMRLNEASTASSTAQLLEEERSAQNKRLEAEEQRSAEEQKVSLKNVARASMIAKAFVFTGIPHTYMEFCNKELGFCFFYPPSWGTPSSFVSRECNNRDDLIGFEGKFREKGDNYFFGVTAHSYRPISDCTTSGRGLGLLDSLPHAETKSADSLIQNESGETIALWYGVPVGWGTNEYDMVFAGSTGHPLATRIAFVGPESSSPDITPNDIEEFLIVAHSFRSTVVTNGQ